MNESNRPKQLQNPPDIQSEYKLFVLRLWRATPESDWRLAIQPTGAQKPQGLPTLSALNQFVLAQMEPTDAIE